MHSIIPIAFGDRTHYIFINGEQILHKSSYNHVQKVYRRYNRIFNCRLRIDADLVDKNSANIDRLLLGYCFYVSALIQLSFYPTYTRTYCINFGAIRLISYSFSRVDTVSFAYFHHISGLPQIIVLSGTSWIDCLHNWIEQMTCFAHLAFGSPGTGVLSSHLCSEKLWHRWG